MNAAIHPRPAAERAPSHYAATPNEETDYPTLLGAVVVDIAIIGGGFTGVATAVELAERGCQGSPGRDPSHRLGRQRGATAARSPGSLSGDAAMHKQMRQWLGAEVEDSSGTSAGAATRSSASGWRSTASPATSRHGHPHAAMKASHMGELQASYEEAVRRGMGDQVVLLDKAGVQAHLETELYCGALKNTRNMHLHPLNLCIGEARAAAGLRADLRTFRGAGYRPRPAAGGDYPRGKRSRRSRSCLPAMSTTSSNAGSSGDDLPGHVAELPPGRWASWHGEINPQGWRSSTMLRPRLLPPHRRRPPAVRWRRQLLGPRLAGHRRRAAAMHRAHLPAPEGRGDRVPVELRHGHRDEPDPPARQALRQRLVLPGLRGMARPPATSWARSWPRR